MSYSYTLFGRLCCDACPASNGVRRRRCPFDYCPAPALCKACYAREKVEGRYARAAHNSCRIASERFNTKLAAEAAVRASGKPVRCAALNAGSGLVHVLFRHADGSTVGCYVTLEAYEVIPFDIPATPESYALYGEVTEAPNSFYSTVKNLE